MRFASFALASAALATTALAAPWAGNDHWQPKGKNVYNGKSYGGNGKWGKHKQTTSPSYGTPPTYGEPSTPETPTTPGNETSPVPPTTPGNETSPAPGDWTCPIAEGTWCLNEEQAQQASDIFRTLIQEYSDEFALEALTEDFVDWTSAVNIIRNRGNDYPFVVNEVSFGSRAEFMAAQGSQPQIPFDTLNVWAGCDTTTTRWQTLNSANGQSSWSNDIPVVGLAVVKTVPDSENSYGFRVKELYSEFNAAAWLVNNGVFTPSAVTTSNPPVATPTSNAKRSIPNVGII